MKSDKRKARALQKKKNKEARYRQRESTDISNTRYALKRRGSITPVIRTSPAVCSACYLRYCICAQHRREHEEREARKLNRRRDNAQYDRYAPNLPKHVRFAADSEAHDQLTLMTIASRDAVLFTDGYSSYRIIG